MNGMTASLGVSRLQTIILNGKLHTYPVRIPFTSEQDPQTFLFFSPLPFSIKGHYKLYCFPFYKTIDPRNK